MYNQATWWPSAQLAEFVSDHFNDVTDRVNMTALTFVWLSNINFEETRPSLTDRKADDDDDDEVMLNVFRCQLTYYY